LLLKLLSSAKSLPNLFSPALENSNKSLTIGISGEKKKGKTSGNVFELFVESTIINYTTSVFVHTICLPAVRVRNHLSYSDKEGSDQPTCPLHFIAFASFALICRGYCIAWSALHEIRVLSSIRIRRAFPPGLKKNINVSLFLLSILEKKESNEIHFQKGFRHIQSKLLKIKNLPRKKKKNGGKFCAGLTNYTPPGKKAKQRKKLSM